MKRLAIGVSDFKKIIEGDFYYFDKTKLIEENKQFSTLFYKIICEFSKLKQYSINLKIV